MAITKQKGCIAEAKVLAYLVSEGYKVFIPWGEDHRFDFLCEVDGSFKRIQVKYVTPKVETIEIPLRSMNNWSKIRYSTKNVDIIAAYNPKNDKVYFVSLNEFTNIAAIKLRFKKAKNSQQKRVRWAADFEKIRL
ncbi:group I intron-associated PD-(D/E)XK endonuclease [Candidatus Margulisiibacteriota bacterium]